MTPDQILLLEAIKERKNISDLLDKIADLDYKNDNGLSPLHYAIKFENKSALIELLKKPINLNIQDKHLNTPLHCAVAGFHDEYAQLLLEAKADPNLQNIDGDTPLHLQAKRGAQGGTTLLAKFNNLFQKSIYMKNKLNETPIHCCILSDNLHMFFFYFDHLRNPYYTQINSKHPNLLEGPNKNGLAHTIISRLANNWPDNEARTFQMLYLLAGVDPSSFSQRNNASMRGETPSEFLMKFPNKTERLINLVEHPEEIHRSIFGAKFAIGVLQENINGIHMQHKWLLTDIGQTKTAIQEVKNDVNDLSSQLAALIKLLKNDNQPETTRTSSPTLFGPK